VALVFLSAGVVRSQTTVYLDTEAGAGLGFGANPSSFLWNTSFATNWTTDPAGNAVQTAWSNVAPPNNAVLGNGTGSGSSTAFLGGGIDVGTVSVVLGTWTISLGSNTLNFNSSSNSTLNTIITGTGSVVKAGTGSMNVTTINNYSGGTTISGGAIRFSASNTAIGPATVNAGGALQIGASNALPAATSVTLAGGSLALAGAFNQSLTTALSMSSSSTLDFGSGFGASAIVFGDSSGQTWTGTLLVSNFSTAGGDTLRFGTTSSALSGSQLAAISFDGIAAQIDASGFVTPVPEPETIAAIFGAGALAFVAFRRRQQALATADAR
jgi:fibronectin-binding autotransporter adhesin